jgi:hypothetical protein
MFIKKFDRTSIDHCMRRSSVSMITLGEIADVFRRRVPLGSKKEVGGASGFQAGTILNTKILLRQKELRR